MSSTHFSWTLLSIQCVFYVIIVLFNWGNQKMSQLFKTLLLFPDKEQRSYKIPQPDLIYENGLFGNFLGVEETWDKDVKSTHLKLFISYNIYVSIVHIIQGISTIFKCNKDNFFDILLFKTFAQFILHTFWCILMHIDAFRAFRCKYAIFDI